jgi:hypothetical protein
MATLILRKMKNVIALLVMLLSGISASGYSFATYKQQVLSSIGDILNDHQKAHPGEPIPSFAELAEKSGLALERIERNLEQPITNVFHILQEKDRFSVPAPHEGTVVIVMTAPSLDGRYGDEPVRRIIFQEKGGVFLSRTVNEAALQAEADKAGYRLPQGEIIRENIPQYILDWGRRPASTNGTTASQEPVPTDDHAAPESPAKQRGREVPTTARHSPSTTALVAVTEAPSAAPRWWLPVAVFAGLGVIAFLLLRARRRG